MATVYTHIQESKRNTVIFIVVYVALITALVWFAQNVYGFDPSFVVIASLASMFMTGISYFASDKIAIASSGAVPVTKEQNPYVVNMVENLAITSGLPAPKVYIIPDRAINAFATGRDPKHASIAVTQGAIDKLENEELEGVIAHEMSHVGNFDIRLMTIVIIMVGVIGIIADTITRGHFIFGDRDRDRGGAGGVLALVGLVLIILSPIIAELIKLAISRKREYLADAGAVLLTRYPEGLARALEKIKNENKPLKKATSATAHLYIANPFSPGKLNQILSTHPPIEERIKRLRGM